MDLQEFDRWLRRYFDAWASNDGDAVAGLFSEDAVYHVDPFSGPRMRGRDQIVEVWTSEPDRQTDVRYEYHPLAVTGDLGVAQWRVSFLPKGVSDRRRELDGVLVIDFDERGLCTVHREWYLSREVPPG